MKQKLLAALKQGWQTKLGLDDEVFERVASAVETFITSEDQIATFVEKAESMLKTYQSIADKVRSPLSQKIKDLEAKLKDAPQPSPQDTPQDTPQPSPQPDDMAAIIAAAVEKAVNPLTQRLSAIEEKDKTSAVLTNASNLFRANEYVKKYKDYADDAWERATTENSLSGGKLTAEELNTKALGYFNKSVSRIGVNTTEPFNGDNGKVDAFDDGFFKSLYERSGRIPKPNNQK